VSVRLIFFFFKNHYFEHFGPNRMVRTVWPKSSRNMGWDNPDSQPIFLDDLKPSRINRLNFLPDGFLQFLVPEFSNFL